ncbi:MAG: DUF2275 domain-containing protein [Nitrospirota bacterium]|nr:DUF2275 domain-containing protein [Nitrospirota bacterium]
MECDKIQELLSAYLERTLSPAERERMDKHLGACPACAASLADLEKTLHYLHGLEDIVPPAWLTQQVMTRVKEESESSKKSLWKKLFFPLYIKLPLEAAGVFLIAVTALYVFKSIEPEIQTVMAPSEETVAEYNAREKEVAPVTKAQKPTQLPAVTRTKKDETIAGVPSLQESKSPPAPASGPFLYDREPAAREKLAEEMEAPEKGMSKSVAPSGAGIELKRELAPRAPGLAMSGLPEKEDMSLSFKAGNISIARDDIKKIFSDLGGRLLKEESTPGSMIINGELASDKLPLFMERLKTLGYVKEKLLPPVSDKDRFLIKINVSTP